MTVFLIRHGQTRGNLERRYIGSTDQRLCARGREALEAVRAPAADGQMEVPHAVLLPQDALAPGVDAQLHPGKVQLALSASVPGGGRRWRPSGPRRRTRCTSPPCSAAGRRRPSSTPIWNRRWSPASRGLQGLQQGHDGAAVDNQGGSVLRSMAGRDRAKRLQDPD